MAGGRLTQVSSTSSAAGALAFTEAMPLSRPASSTYIWLLPMTWPLVAIRLRNGLPLLAVLRSKRPSSWLFLRTDAPVECACLGGVALGAQDDLAVASLEVELKLTVATLADHEFTGHAISLG